MDKNPMDKLGFLLGDWSLEYRIPNSSLSGARTEAGTGSFRRALNDKYVFFDYATETGSAAHGVFAWDARANLYRYSWFENSGSFMTASCSIVGDSVLAMNWHDSLLVQTFSSAGPDKLILRMQRPQARGDYELIMEILFARK